MSCIYYNKTIMKPDSVYIVDRDISGLLHVICKINASNLQNRIFAYVTETYKDSTNLWKYARIHGEYDKLHHRLTRKNPRPMAHAILDDVNYTIALKSGNQLMVFYESEAFPRVCDSIQFASIHFSRDIVVLRKAKGG